MRRYHASVLAAARYTFASPGWARGSAVQCGFLVSPYAIDQLIANRNFFFKLADNNWLAMTSGEANHNGHSKGPSS
jgi:hypothetical protein